MCKYKDGEYFERVFFLKKINGLCNLFIVYVIIFSFLFLFVLSVFNDIYKSRSKRCRTEVSFSYNFFTVFLIEIRNFDENNEFIV